MNFNKNELARDDNQRIPFYKATATSRVAAGWTNKAQVRTQTSLSPPLLINDRNGVHSKLSRGRANTGH